MEEKVEILKQIANKGGILGMVARYCLEDEKKFDGNQFLIECYEQCDINSVQNLFGLELVNDIINYNVKYNGK